MRLVVREGMRLTVIGLGLGLVASLGLGLVMSKVLYGVGAVDAGVFVGVTRAAAGRLGARVLSAGAPRDAGGSAGRAAGGVGPLPGGDRGGQRTLDTYVAHSRSGPATLAP